MNSEECALWDRIVGDYLDSRHGKEIFQAIIVSSKGEGIIERTRKAVEGAVSVGAALADAALAERRKRFTAVPVDGWKLAKFQISSGTCCYCDAWPVQIYQRGNVYFGCEKCTGLAPQDADTKLPGGG